MIRPVGQAVKTPPFHGGNSSSILLRVTKKKRENFILSFFFFSSTRARINTRPLAREDDGIHIKAQKPILLSKEKSRR